MNGCTMLFFRAGERQRRQESGRAAEGDRGERGHHLQDPARHSRLARDGGHARKGPHEGSARDERVSKITRHYHSLLSQSINLHCY